MWKPQHVIFKLRKIVMDNLRQCPFCLKDQSNSVENTVTIGKKGVDGIMKAANQRGDTQMTVCVGQKAHVSCRQSYTNTRKIE